MVLPYIFKQHGSNTMKKEILHMKIDPDLKQALHEQAKKENRSLSNLVETLVKEYIERKK